MLVQLNNNQGITCNIHTTSLPHFIMLYIRQFRVHASIILKDLSLDPTEQFLIAEFLLLVVDHRKLVGFELVLLQLHGLADQIGQLYHIPRLGIVFDGLLAHIR